MPGLFLFSHRSFVERKHRWKRPELTTEHVDYLVLLSDKLATKYPELNARIQRAVSIVRAGGVQLHGDDLAAVTNGGEAPYEVTGEGCACEDFVRGNAPRGMCKHRLAVHICCGRPTTILTRTSQRHRQTRSRATRNLCRPSRRVQAKARSQPRRTPARNPSTG